ncbi:MAG: BolA family transcriptional regulator [Bdellovibrionaceae bacterium]|nr:BolA family transcriptional regulator [Pseudobdellovibrionaceae bacterium]
MGPREALLRTKIESTFNPEYYELVNESYMHSVPKGSESHFKVLIVSEKFAGKPRLERSRMVTELFKDEMNTGLHALSQRTMTPEEWAPVKDTFEMVSPECRGGSKAP